MPTLFKVLTEPRHLIQMRRIPRNLPRASRFRPMVHQALGRNIQTILQPFIAPQIQLLVKECRLQLIIQLLE